MQKDRVRIAHLTDIHVATNRDVWQTALKHAGVGLAVAAPVVAAIEGLLRLFEKPNREKLRIPIYVIAGLTALLGMMIHPTLRRRLLFLRDVALLINQSSAAGREALFDSLRQKRIDHLLITGDLSTSSRHAEFKTIAQELRRHGWEGDRLTILPGNHDRIGFDGYSNFEQHFPAKLPAVRELAPGVVLVGLDSTMRPPHRSVWEDLWDDVFTNLRGQLDPKAINPALAQIGGVSDETVVIGLHHPPIDLRSPAGRIRQALRPSFKEPANADALGGLLKNRNHLVLCGHDHPRQPRLRETDGWQVAMGTASGLALGNRKRGKTLSYRVFDVAPKGRYLVEDVTVAFRDPFWNLADAAF